MSNPLEHYRQAERLLEAADALGGAVDSRQQANLIAMAQVHATLATLSTADDDSLVWEAR